MDPTTSFNTSTLAIVPASISRLGRYDIRLTIDWTRALSAGHHLSRARRLSGGTQWNDRSQRSESRTLRVADACRQRI